MVFLDGLEKGLSTLKTLCLEPKSCGGRVESGVLFGATGLGKDVTFDRVASDESGFAPADVFRSHSVGTRRRCRERAVAGGRSRVSCR